MKRLIKILLIVCGVIAALMIAGSVAVSPVLKRYIERNAKSLIGRSVTMDRLTVNVFTGGVAIRNFTMYEPDGTTPFATFAKFKTRIRLIPLLHSQLHIAHTTLAAPRLHVSQQGSAFNFDDLVSRFTDASATADASGTPSPWTLGIDGVSIRDGNLTYNDLSAGSAWNFEGMTLDIPGLTFGGGATRTGLDLRFANGGTLRSEVEYDTHGERYDLRLRFDEFPVEGLLPYLQQTMYVSELAGTLTGELQIKGTLAHVMDFDLRGEATLHGISLLDDRNRPVIGIETIDANIRRINPARSTAEFNLLAVSGVSTTFEIRKDGLNNFTYLLKPLPDGEEVDAQQPENEASVPPMRIAVDDLRIGRSTLVYTDHTLSEPFSYTLSDIALTAHNFDSGGRNRISLRAVMQQAGNLRAEWTGCIKDLADQRITLEIHNLSLRDLSPWSEAWFGYPVTGGTLSLTSRNQISDGMIDGANHIEIYRPQVGKKPRRSKPEYKVPLKMGLYVMADNRGRIDLDIPVAGEIGSPGFSYKKIAMGAFTNMITKVVTAPVVFMADALGFKNRQIEQIAFDPLQREFSAEQYGKFNELAEIVKNKPGLKLSLIQRVDFQSAIERQAMDNLQKVCYARMRGLDDMSGIDPDDWRRADLKQRDLSACADAMLTEAKLRVKGNLAQKAMTLFGERSRDEVEEGIFLRNVLLSSHFTTGLGVPEDCVTVSSETDREMKRNKDKNLFSVEIALPDEDDVPAEGDTNGE